MTLFPQQKTKQSLLPTINIGSFTLQANPVLQAILIVELAEHLINRMHEKLEPLDPDFGKRDGEEMDRDAPMSDVVSVAFQTISIKDGELIRRTNKTCNVLSRAKF